MQIKFKIPFALFMIGFFVKAHTQQCISSICGVDYKMEYKIGKNDTTTIITCSVLIRNNSKTDVYLPIHRSFYVLTETYFIQKLGVLFNDLKDNPINDDGKLIVMLLKHGDSTKYELSCETKLLPTDIKQLLLSIDFLLATNVRKKDFVLPEQLSVDGKKITLNRNEFLISLAKYRRNSIWVNTYSKPIFSK